MDQKSEESSPTQMNSPPQQQEIYQAPSAIYEEIKDDIVNQK
jgi:hypothetical protein